MLFMLKKWKDVLNLILRIALNLLLQHSNFRIPCEPRVSKLDNSPTEPNQ